MKFLSITCLFTLFLLFFASCGDDDMMISDPGESFILQESVFGCMSYFSTEVGEEEDDFRIKTFFVDGDRYFLGGFDGLILREGITGTNQILLEEGLINEILKLGQDVMVASQDGLFAIDMDNNVRQVSDLSCSEMLLTANGELLIGLGANTNGLDAAFIYQIDPADGSTLAYTENRIEGTCSNVGRFEQSGNGDIWAVSCDGTIVRFEDRRLTAEYTTENSPLNDFHVSSNMWLAIYNGDPVFVGKNGIDNYQIMQFKGGEWLDVKNFALTQEPSAKELFMRGPSITDAFVDGDFLYLSTTLAGCRGIQRFDLSSDLPIAEEDFTVFLDPGLPEQCIQGIFSDPQTGVFYIYTQVSLTRIDGC